MVFDIGAGVQRVAEQSAFANELATTGGAQWRYASAALSLRWALQ